MPGENSGGGADAGYRPPAPPKRRPSSNPGGKNPRAPKRGQSRPPRPHTPAPAPKPKHHTSSGGSGYSGGGSGYGGDGGGGGGLSSNSLGTLAAPAPVAPSIDAYLGGDDTYQSQMAAYKKALSNYKTQMTERQDEYNQDYARRTTDLGITEDRNRSDQQDDYAGRGLYFSGLYGKALGDLTTDFDRRQGDMDLAKQQWLNGVNRDYTNFQEENDLNEQKAKQDALQRRALQYNLTA